jgi:phage replication-related protein YjqB (UPF0714/DUF867 family)
MVPDTYRSFIELSTTATADIDYKIDVQDRGTSTVIVGIHGGEIEPHTELIVTAIANPDLSYYLFVGNTVGQHITSTRFDEPRCLDLIARHKTVISIHGKSGPEAFVMLGGLDTQLVESTAKALADGGFEVRVPTAHTAGTESTNICNKGTSGKGLQIEMSRGLRESLLHDPVQMRLFTQSIRQAIL